MVEKHHTGNAGNRRDSSTIINKQASTQTERCLESDTFKRDQLVETDPLFCWNCSQLLVTMESTDPNQAVHRKTGASTDCKTENKQVESSADITPTKSKGTNGGVIPTQTAPRDSMLLRQKNNEQVPQKQKKRSTCNESPNIEDRNIHSVLKKSEDKFKLKTSDISIRAENPDSLRGPSATQRVEDGEVICNKEYQSTHQKEQMSCVKENDPTPKKKHRKKAKNKNKNTDHGQQEDCVTSILKQTHSSQQKIQMETVVSHTTKSNFKQNGSHKKSDKKTSTLLNCTHVKSVYLGGKKSKMNESDLETILQDFEQDYTTVCLQCEVEAQSQKFSNDKKVEESKKMEEYTKQGARPKVSLKTKGPYFAGDSCSKDLGKPSLNHSKDPSIRPKESSRDSDYLSMMRKWPANIGKNNLLKNEKAKYVCKVKEALNFVIYFRPVDYCVSEVQLDSPHSIPTVGENRMGLTDFADLFLMHDLLPYYQTPPASEHYEMVFESLTVRGSPLIREVFIAHQNSASRQERTLVREGAPQQDVAHNHESLPSFNDIFTPKTNTPLSNTRPGQKSVSPEPNTANDNFKKSPTNIHTSAAPKSKPKKNWNVPKLSANSNVPGVPKSTCKKTSSKSSERTKSTELYSQEFKIPSYKHVSLSVTLQQPIVELSPTQDLPICAPHAPPSAPQALPSAPQAPTSAPQAPPSAPQAPTSAPQAPTSAPQAPTSAPQAPPSAPQATQSVAHLSVAESDQPITSTQNVDIIITPPEEISSIPLAINPTIRRTTHHKGPVLCMTCNGAGCGDPKRLCYAEVYRDTCFDDQNSNFSDSSDSTIFDFDESLDYEESFNSFAEDEVNVMSPPPTYEKALELGMTKKDDANIGFHTRIKRLPRPHLRKNMTRCINCRRRQGVSLKLCIQCELATYCCMECQLEDHQRHREECKRTYKWKCACQRLEPYMLHYLTNYNLQVVTEFRQVPDCYQSLQGFNRALLCEVSGRCDYYPREDYAVFIQDESGLEVPLVFSINEGSYYMPDSSEPIPLPDSSEPIPLPDSSEPIPLPDSSEPIPLSRLLYPGRLIIFLHPVWMLFHDFREGFRLTDLRNMFVIKELSEL